MLGCSGGWAAGTLHLRSIARGVLYSERSAIDNADHIIEHTSVAASLLGPVSCTTTASCLGDATSYASEISAKGRTVKSLHFESMTAWSTASISSVTRGRDGSRWTRDEAERFGAVRLVFFSAARAFDGGFLVAFSARGFRRFVGDEACALTLRVVLRFLPKASSALGRVPVQGSMFSLSGA